MMPLDGRAGTPKPGKPEDLGRRVGGPCSLPDLGPEERQGTQRLSTGCFPEITALRLCN